LLYAYSKEIRFTREDQREIRRPDWEFTAHRGSSEERQPHFRTFNGEKLRDQVAPRVVRAWNQDFRWHQGPPHSSRHDVQPRKEREPFSLWPGNDRSR
jgi:hypothetical protein